MIEGDRCGECIGGKEPGGRRVITSPEFPQGVDEKHRGNGVMPGIAPGFGVGVELLRHLARQTGLFLQLPSGDGSAVCGPPPRSDCC